MVKKLIEKGKFLIVGIAIVLSSFAVQGILHEGSAATKSTEKYQQYYSWVGLKIFKTGVIGWYDSDGKKVTSFNKVSQKHSTGLAWSFGQTESYWTSKKYGTSQGLFTSSVYFRYHDG